MYSFSNWPVRVLDSDFNGIPEDELAANSSEVLLPVLARGICRRLSMLCKLASRLDVSSETVEAILVLPAAMDELTSSSSSSSMSVMVVFRDRSSNVERSPASDIELSTSISETTVDLEDDPSVDRGMLDVDERQVCACC